METNNTPGRRSSSSFIHAYISTHIHALIHTYTHLYTLIYTYTYKRIFIFPPGRRSSSSTRKRRWGCRRGKCRHRLKVKSEGRRRIKQREEERRREYKWIKYEERGARCELKTRNTKHHKTQLKHQKNTTKTQLKHHKEQQHNPQLIS
jgi:hypothetical protein